MRAKEEIQQTIPKLFNRPQQPNRGLVGELQANAPLDDWMKCGGYRSAEGHGRVFLSGSPILTPA